MNRDNVNFNICRLCWKWETTQHTGPVYKYSTRHYAHARCGIVRWGREWLDGSLWFKNTMPNGDDSRRMRIFERTNAAGLETGDVNEYVIANVAAGIEFRATLTWFDPASALGAASTLVNDLDLEVVDPNSVTYLGNNFSGGDSTPGGTADNANRSEERR